MSLKNIDDVLAHFDIFSFQFQSPPPSADPCIRLEGIRSKPCKGIDACDHCGCQIKSLSETHVDVRLSMSAKKRDEESDISKSELQAENDVYSTGVHEALLQLGYAAGMQGKTCEDGIKLLLTAIVALQDSETHLLARQETMRDEITQLVAMVQAMRKKLKERAVQEQEAAAAAAPASVTVSSKPPRAAVYRPASSSSSMVATPRGARGGRAAGVDQSSLKETSVGQDGALADLATPRGPLNREVDGATLLTPRHAARTQQAHGAPREAASEVAEKEGLVAALEKDNRELKVKHAKANEMSQALLQELETLKARRGADDTGLAAGDGAGDGGGGDQRRDYADPVVVVEGKGVLETAGARLYTRKDPPAITDTPVPPPRDKPLSLAAARKLAVEEGGGWGGTAGDRSGGRPPREGRDNVDAGRDNVDAGRHDSIRKARPAGPPPNLTHASLPSPRGELAGGGGADGGGRNVVNVHVQLSERRELAERERERERERAIEREREREREKALRRERDGERHKSRDYDMPQQGYTAYLDVSGHSVTLSPHQASAAAASRCARVFSAAYT